jgi:hypothetical protein
MNITKTGINTYIHGILNATEIVQSMNIKMLIQDDEFRVYPEEGPMPRALEASFSLVLPMVESVSCLK